MKLLYLALPVFTLWSHVISIDVPAPEFHIRNNMLIAEHGTHITVPGVPDIPCRIVTIAVPPGALVESVQFLGKRQKFCSVAVQPVKPPLPLTDINAIEQLYQQYAEKYNDTYTTDAEYPQEYGIVLSRGGLRKYSLVTVACYHFSYNPVSQNLYYSPNIFVEIQYTVPEPESKQAQHRERLMNDITVDDLAKELIFNWDDAQSWYATETPQQANGYYIIVPSSIQSSVDSLVAWRQNLGYEVHVITREYIETNIAGNDLPQKIRNYLRTNMAGIEYVLLVGFSSDMPWRSMVPFNNDPDSPWNHPDYSPIPSDLYYAELTDPDSLSWDADGDGYYGEVFDENFQLVGEDNPDYHADIHVGRIPFSTQSVIEEICEKMIAFDNNTDVAYKTASLLAGAVYYYANENNGGNARMDGADYAEQLMNDTILNRSNAVYIYEKGGLRPCLYSCTDSLTRNNMTAYWQNKGVMYECHHGNVNVYARKVWAWDDGDSIPENYEIQWPTSLQSSDVYQLDNVHPATAFLRSCLCGKPEETGLGALLLYRGASSVISSSRISWATSADYGGIPYHFYNRLLKDTTESNGLIGTAYDIARNDFMANTSFWLPAYHYNLFGDPALCQFGRFTGIQEWTTKQVAPSFAVYPNPTRGELFVRMNSSIQGSVTLDVYDVQGRCVCQLLNGEIRTSTNVFDIQLPTGIYFFRCKTHSTNECMQKVIVVNE